VRVVMVVVVPVRALRFPGVEVGLQRISHSLPVAVPPAPCG
jgi:hypothetical protein